MRLLEITVGQIWKNKSSKDKWQVAQVSGEKIIIALLPRWFATPIACHFMEKRETLLKEYELYQDVAHTVQHDNTGASLEERLRIVEKQVKELLTVKTKKYTYDLYIDRKAWPGLHIYGNVDTDDFIDKLKDLLLKEYGSKAMGFYPLCFNLGDKELKIVCKEGEVYYLKLWEKTR